MSAESASEFSAIALNDNASHISIAQLTPTLASKDSRVIKAVVTLVWPYSSITRSISFLLSEPDFRLRKTRGQVRVQFSRSSGVSVAKAGIASGDRVTLSLKGVEWVEEDSDIKIPGYGVGFKLKFTEKLSLQFQRDGSNDLENVDIDHPPINYFPTDITKSPTPETEFNTAYISSKSNHSLFRQAINDSDIYSFPAFVKRARTSYGYLFDSSLDSFAEIDGLSQKKGRKRARLSLTWEYEVSSSSSEEGDNPEHPIIAVEPLSSVMVDQSVQTCDDDCVEKMDLLGPFPTSVANYDIIDQISIESSSQKQSGSENKFISIPENHKSLALYASDRNPADDKTTPPQKSPNHSHTLLDDPSQTSILPISDNTPLYEYNELVQTDQTTEETKCVLVTSISGINAQTNDITMEVPDQKRNEVSSPELEKILPKNISSHVPCALGSEATYEAISDAVLSGPSDSLQSKGTHFSLSESFAKFKDSENNNPTVITAETRNNSFTEMSAHHESEGEDDPHQIDQNSSFDICHKRDISLPNSNFAVATIDHENDKISSPGSDQLSRKTSIDFADKIHENTIENTKEHVAENAAQEKTDLDKFKMSTGITDQFTNSFETQDEDCGDIEGKDESIHDIDGPDEDNQKKFGEHEDLCHDSSDSETHDSYSEEIEYEVINSDPEHITNYLEYLEQYDCDGREKHINNENITVIDLISDEEELGTTELAPNNHDSNLNQLEINSEATEEDEIDEIDLLPYREETDSKIKSTQNNSRFSSPHEESILIRCCSLDCTKECNPQMHEDTEVHLNLSYPASIRDDSVLTEETSGSFEKLHDNAPQKSCAENQKECSPFKSLSSQEIFNVEESLDACIVLKSTNKKSFFDQPLCCNPVNIEKSKHCTSSYLHSVHLESSTSESENLVEKIQDNKNSLYSRTRTNSEDPSSSKSSDTNKSRLRGHDASIQLAISSLCSPSKKWSSLVDIKLKLGRILKTELIDFTSLKNLRYYSNQKLDVLAIVTSLPSRPKRMKNGPKEYLISFYITDHTVNPNNEVLVRVSCPRQESLPEIEIGNGILLRNFERISECNKSILRSLKEEVSSWVVFKDTGDPQARGPPVDHGVAEEKYISQLKTWFSQKDTKNLAKMAKANEKRTRGKKVSV